MAAASGAVLADEAQLSYCLLFFYAVSRPLVAGRDPVFPAERFPLHPAPMGPPAGLRHRLRDAHSQVVQVLHILVTVASA